MKLGIVIYSGDVETVWNAFRLGIVALKKDDTAEIVHESDKVFTFYHGQSLPLIQWAETT